MTPLAQLTTLGLGGPARRLVDCGDEASLIATVQEADRNREPLLVLAGGSNLVVADAGFPGVVARVLTRGVEVEEGPERVLVRVAAGESWDEVVASCVGRGLAGIECLSGIPGSAGATPIQNVGAYGQEVRQTITEVCVYDRVTDAVCTMPPEACGFSYRSSTFKRTSGRWVVLAVTFALEPSPQSRPVKYPELARSLGVEVGATVPLREARDAVLDLRRAKGMVIDSGDPDTVSAGSFFLNPVLDAIEMETLRERVRQVLGTGVSPPAYPEPGDCFKTSAAWLVERAGFGRGWGNPRGIAISRKHTLALTNRGGGTTAELLAAARQIAGRVQEIFGVWLQPEPVLVGCEWRVG